MGIAANSIEGIVLVAGGTLSPIKSGETKLIARVKDSEVVLEQPLKVQLVDRITITCEPDTCRFAPGDRFRLRAQAKSGDGVVEGLEFEWTSEPPEAGTWLRVRGRMRRDHRGQVLEEQLRHLVDGPEQLPHRMPAQGVVQCTCLESRRQPAATDARLGPQPATRSARGALDQPAAARRRVPGNHGGR